MPPSNGFLTLIGLWFLGTALTRSVLDITGLPKTIPSPFHDKKELDVAYWVGILMLTLCSACQIASASQRRREGRGHEQEREAPGTRFNR